MSSERRPERSARYLNRELSWIEFDRRVLEQASDPAIPLLERVRFLAISASNLDEFFMVRVGGLWMLARQGRAQRDISGRTPREQLAAIAERVRDLVERQYALWIRDLEPALGRAGLARAKWEELDGEARRHAERIWQDEVLPLLTPRAVPDGEAWPQLAGLTLHMVARLRRPPDGPWPAGEGWVVVAIPRSLPRWFALPFEGGTRLLFIEDLVRGFAPQLWPGAELLDTAMFRITRNADLELAEDQAADLLAGMEDILAARRESDVVRLEIESGVPSAIAEWLRAGLGVPSAHVTRAPGPLGLADLMRLADLPGAERLRFAPWPPADPPAWRRGEPLMPQIARRDMLLYAPFESFDPVVQFIEEAADDPDVLAIKQTLYRTSRNSPVIAALIRAAESGKQVTAVVELKARFDEERNIEWARALERAGVQVIAGVRGYKVHAKCCLVVRREAGGIRRYVHFGTGNYNERTARQYCDISLLSASDDYGADAAAFFNAVTGLAQPGTFRRIEMAPLGLRRRLLELIEGERRHAEAGGRGRIVAKMNSLSDRELIDALYAASRAGVSITLLVRGICCLRPGVPGLSERIRVVSVVDRFLEHARIFWFHRGGDPAIFISSADWMPRNLDKRIELLIEVVDPAARRRLETILDVCAADNVQAWELRGDGSYERLRPPARGARVRSQQRLYELAQRAARLAHQADRRRLSPYRLKGERPSDLGQAPGSESQRPRSSHSRQRASATARR
ncbi:MAG: polyphosphate kinase 1 [Kiritimatiellae bacterium]|nr:polyphosphate kinase 1 [Kiritimatiellia bacterium]